MDPDQGALSDRSSEYQKGNMPTPQQQQRAEIPQYSGPYHQYSVPTMQQKNYGYSTKEGTESNMSNYIKMASGIYESGSCPHFPIPRHNEAGAPTFSSPPNSPLVGLVFDPTSTNYMGGSQSGLAADRSQTWTANSDPILPIGTGARKKIMKTQPDVRCYSGDRQTHRDAYFTKPDNKSNNYSNVRKRDGNLISESSTSLDFLAEGERMVSELCNAAEMSSGRDSERNQGSKPYCFVVTKERSQESIETLLNSLDKIVIHDQIPNEIVQLAIEACTDAENIAIAHHNRPCFKNIHSICAKTRSNVQKSDSAVANLHSQGIPWVIKNFIFSFVRILDGWKGVKELLCEKHDTFSRIENKYYSPNIRECFFQWQAVTKEMLSHIYKTFKCLDQGFTMEQKSFTHNYYATNPSATRHQNQSKFQQSKVGPNASRPVSVSSQTYGGTTGQWSQNAAHGGSQTYSESSWSARSAGGVCKKYPVAPPPHSYVYPSSDATDSDRFHHKPHVHYDPGFHREQKPRQSWTITNMHDIRALENLNNFEQRQLYAHLKQNVDAELGSGSGSLLMESKAKMIPVSHVEKSLIPSMASGGDGAPCFEQKKNSGDSKEEMEIFTEWSRVFQKESCQPPTQHKQSTLPTNSIGPAAAQLIDPENDEYHDQSKVYMKPGSYKVPIKPSDSVNSFPQDAAATVFDNASTNDVNPKTAEATETGNSSSIYSMESWSFMQSNRPCDFSEVLRQAVTQAGASDECAECVPSDQAWEAAKQSAPKLMDYIYDGSKSDAARLYDALGFSTQSDEYAGDYKRFISQINRDDPACLNKVSRIWNQRENLSEKEGQYIQADYHDSDSKFKDNQNDKLDQDNASTSKTVETKEDGSQSNTEDEPGKDKKILGRPKIAISQLWYQPKKNRPISTESSKMFEQISAYLSRMSEADFIQNDMDIKSAPRFYDIVRHPVCLTDINTKLKSCSYTDTEQVVHDFRRVFNNVRLYLKTYPDATMKKNVSKVSTEFEKMFAEEFNKLGPAPPDRANEKETCKIDDQKKMTLSDNKEKSDLAKVD